MLTSGKMCVILVLRLNEKATDKNESEVFQDGQQRKGALQGGQGAGGGRCGMGHLLLRAREFAVVCGTLARYGLHCHGRLYAGSF